MEELVFLKKRLKRIGEILDVDVAKLLSTEDLKLDIHNNTFHDNSSVISELNTKNEELYERLLQEKDDKNKLLKETIEFLKNEIQKLNKFNL